ncbi:helix-turn-helix domain-containing protein [Anaerosalibacter massiliensis]|uniref:Helix-turn-helix domain-containing protein n=1 Tax=Anaerosalibacter massiliensis TaxID=1347392 RepID=A0A9X2S4G0_9FIRM|nr:helix-turn-helix transcriptional regulator [Anaerosalibacter massiliensis]MCR2043229.1 helix-turn-helix domain-containing protein [Anaerosalibacter massiliensis]
MFGDRIKEERTLKQMTQKELSKFLGVSPSTVGMYEQNRRQPDSETIIKLSEIFNVSTDYLLGRTDIKNPENEDKEMKRLANKEIKSVEDALEIIKFQDGLMLNGKILNDEDKMLLANALQLGMKYVLEQEEKKKEKGEKKNK